MELGPNAKHASNLISRLQIMCDKNTDNIRKEILDNVKLVDINDYTGQSHVYVKYDLDTPIYSEFETISTISNLLRRADIVMLLWHDDANGKDRRGLVYISDVVAYVLRRMKSIVEKEEEDAEYLLKIL